MPEMSFKLTVDNTDAVRKATKEAVDVALEAVGLQAERYAKLLCPVDTGLLRNSITHAVYGKNPSISKYESEKKHASTKVTRKNNTAGKPVDPVKTGSYQGVAPTSDGPAVYLGTNVEYAA